jgi:hypothetical protein
VASAVAVFAVDVVIVAVTVVVVFIVAATIVAVVTVAVVIVVVFVVATTIVAVFAIAIVIIAVAVVVVPLPNVNGVLVLVRTRHADGAVELEDGDTATTAMGRGTLQDLKFSVPDVKRHQLAHGGAWTELRLDHPVNLAVRVGGRHVDGHGSRRRVGQKPALS